MLEINDYVTVQKDKKVFYGVIIGRSKNTEEYYIKIDNGEYHWFKAEDVTLCV